MVLFLLEFFVSPCGCCLLCFVVAVVACAEMAAMDAGSERYLSLILIFFLFFFSIKNIILRDDPGKAINHIIIFYSAF